MAGGDTGACPAWQPWGPSHALQTSWPATCADLVLNCPPCSDQSALAWKFLQAPGAAQQPSWAPRGWLLPGPGGSLFRQACLSLDCLVSSRRRPPAWQAPGESDQGPRCPVKASGLGQRRSPHPHPAKAALTDAAPAPGAGDRSQAAAPGGRAASATGASRAQAALALPQPVLLG